MGTRRHIAPLALAIFVCAVPPARAQAAIPSLAADPAGKVVDERGKPVAGAEIELRTDLTSEGVWSNAIAQVLAATPLPSATSDGDGDFVLPLTRLQRTLGAFDEGSFWLVVRKEGRRTWTEHLGSGVHGYLGSRVVLPAVTEPDPLAGLPWPPIAPLVKDNDDPQVAAVRECRMPESAERRTGVPRRGAEGGNTKLVVKVRDAEGKPVAGAVLRFSDDVFARSAPVSAQVWTSDEQGVVTIEGISAGGGSVAAIADGYQAKPTALKVPREGVHEVTLALEPVRSFAITTIDADAAPAPFAAMTVLLAAEQPQNRNTRRVLSDSLGRVWIHVPVNLRATLYTTPTLHALTLGPDTQERLDMNVLGTETWLALVPPSNSWKLMIRTARSSSSRSNQRLGEAGIDSFLVRAPVGSTTTLECSGAKKPGATIDGTQGKEHTIAGYTVKVFDRRVKAESRPASQTAR